MNEDSIEDLTLDDDDISNMESMDDGAGPSHGNAGEGSSQGNLKKTIHSDPPVLRNSSLRSYMPTGSLYHLGSV
jgi:hypothetical protein